jgi:hypothetical protein
MTPLNNNKGVALVILVIAMTLIAVLATSLVSIVADKNKSMIYAYDGFHASIIADSGAAFAIRYISEGLSDTSKPYFYDDLKNRAGSIDWKCYSSVYKPAGVTDPIGRFKVTRNLPTNLADIDNDTILVESSYNGGIAVRKVKVKQFRRFLSPITLYPDYNTRPKRQGSQIDVRVLGNHSSDLSVTKIEIMVPASTPGEVYLKKVYLYPSEVFSFADVLVQNAYNLSVPSRDCSVNPDAPCLDSTKGLKLVKGAYVTLEGPLPHTVKQDDANSYYQFVFESAPHLDRYSVKLTTGSGTPVLSFTPYVES